MKKVLIALSVLGCILPSAPAQSDESLIRETVLPLPESLRAGAEVIQYEEGTRKKVIRKGTNGWICAADDPGGEFMVLCYYRELQHLYQRARELALQGEGAEERQSILGKEAKSGKLKVPEHGVAFVVRGLNQEVALPLTVVVLPFATAESTGLPTEIDPHRPWLMNAGTATAHIMLPGQ